jgi:uncharacterized protein
VATTRQLSNREARWLAIEAQGLGRPRPQGQVGRRQLLTLMGRIGMLQLDAINVLERTQFVVPFSRLGPYDGQRLRDMTGPGGELFEYWGHAASLLPMDTYPLVRWRMEQHGTADGRSMQDAARRAWRESQAGYIAAVLEEVRERGPLAASALADPRRRTGEWWERRSLGRLALEWLFAKGELAAWRSATFERVYDLAERVIPKPVLAQPTPSAAEAQRALLTGAAKSLGVATIGDLADYYRVKPNDAKARVGELVESGDLVRVLVDGWRQPAYCPRDVRLRSPSRGHATLLSPFDSLIWERERTRRLFGFDYRIEVYVPEPDREYGYYVLPLLLGDELVARLDLKADRGSSTLRVYGAYLEPAADRGAVGAAAATELDVLRSWLGLDKIAVAGRGNLASTLKRSIGSPRPRPSERGDR